MILRHSSATTSFKRRPPIRRRRRGAILVVAMVCLLVVTAIVGAMLHRAIVARRQLHAERNLRQTELLADAGAERALRRVADDAEYRGETWRLSAGQIIGRDPGEVTIQLTHGADDEPWSVRVVAAYPADSEVSVRRTRTFTIPQPASPSEE